ncbi:MAG: hypothetical protein LBH67_03135 [Rickettsia sp.]|jgi:predicted transcriptional regulator|nr:hypothetical protein [Rickettsia sp.]
MTLVTEIQQFLRSKFEELKLTRRDFSEQSGIPYNNITSILNGISSSPQMYNGTVERRDRYGIMKKKKKREL